MKNKLLKKLILFLISNILLTITGFAAENHILGKYSEGNPEDIVEQAYKNAKWKDLSIEIRQIKSEPSEGFSAMKLKNPVKNGKVYYVSPIVILNLRDFTGMDVFYRPWMENNLGVNIYLKKDAQAKFRDYINKNVKEFIGILVNGELRSVIKIMEPIMPKELSIGEFSAIEALDIVKKFFKPLESAWPYFG